MRAARLVALSAIALSMALTESALTPVRVTFLTDCTIYSGWMSLGMQFSFKMSGQPGKITRVACCTPEEKEKYPELLKKSVDTWLAPSMAVHPRNGDHYAAYNKPEAVVDYLANVTPEEEYMLVLDSDMVLRRPFLVEDMQPKKGLAIGARYSYMIGVANELAPRHIPEIAPRNDTLAGPKGRRADEVGGFFFIHRDDLKRMSPLWLKYTEDVRFDDMAYKYSGDVYAIHPGDKPWISEMYGYAFGAAKADVWHKWDTYSMIYPEYEPHGVPKLMHYGLHFKVDNYTFDKHWHFNFNALECPPWDLTSSRGRRSGLFEHPPRIATISTKGGPKGLYYRDLLAVETVATINAGLCDFHLSHCSPSKQMLDECKTAWEIYQEVTAEIRKVEENFGCTDFNDKCKEWADAGQCNSNPEYMQETCKTSCNVCGSGAGISKEDLVPPSTDLPDKLAKLEKELASASVKAVQVAPKVVVDPTGAVQVSNVLWER